MALITASFDTLLRQGSASAEVYLINAIKNIDEQLGAGYAREHPELIAAFMTAACNDVCSSVIGKVFEEALDNAADRIASAIESIEFK